MSNTNGQVSFVKSMNSILSFNTGSGTIISGDTITTNNLDVTNFNTNNLQGITPTDAITLYTNSTNNISLGSPVGLGTLALTNKLINIGTSANTIATTLAGTLTTISSTTTNITGSNFNVNCPLNSISPIYCTELHAANAYITTSLNTTFLDTPNTTDTPYIFPLTTGTITIGSATAPIIGQRVCTAPTHLANKQYVDSLIQTSLLGLTNIWTGVSNTFNNTIIGNTITATAISSIVNLFNNLTTGTLNIATGITTGALNIGTNITNGNIIIGNDNTIGATGNLSLRAKNVADIGAGSASVFIGIGSPTINIGTSIVGGTPTINIGTTAFTTININGQFGKPINPGYDANYVINVGTPIGCIGNYITADVNNSGAITSGTAKHFNTFTNLPIGVWMLYYQQVFTCPTTNCALTASLQMRMGTTTTGAEIGIMFADSPTAVLTVGNTKSYLYTQIYTNTSATTDVYFNIYTFFTGTLSGNLASVLYVKALRLA